MTLLKYDIFTRETVKLSPLFITLKKKKKHSCTCSTISQRICTELALACACLELIVAEFKPVFYYRNKSHRTALRFPSSQWHLSIAPFA